MPGEVKAPVPVRIERDQDEPKHAVRELIFDRFELEGPIPDRSARPIAGRRRVAKADPRWHAGKRRLRHRVRHANSDRPLRRGPFGVRSIRDEIRPYVDLTLAAAKEDPFDRAIQTGLTAILVSPHFLFRVEQPGNPGEGADPVPISAYELASRLSYFLWSSMPDDELFRLAADGSLQKPDVLEAQVRRMLRDKKSRALVDNFAVQWLNLAQLDAVRPSRKIFKDFDRDLRADMRRETELFFESIVHEDRSILELLNGTYTFLDERLAKLYGIPGIEGDEFRQVSLERLSAGGRADSGEHSHADVAADADLAGQTGKMDSGDIFGKCTASSAGRRSGIGRDQQSQPEGVPAGTAGHPPAELEVLGLPQSDGSTGIWIGEFRRNWPMAREGKGSARRCLRHPAGRRIVPRAARAGGGPVQTARRLSPAPRPDAC